MRAYHETVAENPIVRSLGERVRSGGAEPLLTWYRPDDAARTELSVRTFANWVDKTANLLDTLGVEGMIAGAVNLGHPGHWMSLVWPLAAWQRGCGYLADSPEPACELVVVGPDNPQPCPGITTVACSLHPLGLGLTGLPDGVVDFTGEALAEPDTHWVTPVEPFGTAWADADRRLNHAETGQVEPEARRILVRPTTPWETLAVAVVGPILGGGSAVVVEGPADGAMVARLAAAERAVDPMA